MKINRGIAICIFLAFSSSYTMQNNRSEKKYLHYTTQHAGLAAACLTVFKGCTFFNVPLKDDVRECLACMGVINCACAVYHCPRESMEIISNCMKKNTRPALRAPSSPLMSRENESERNV